MDERELCNLSFFGWLFFLIYLFIFGGMSLVSFIWAQVSERAKHEAFE